MRYVRIAAFLAVLAAIALAIEAVLAASGQAISLTDARGAGQVIAFALLLAGVLIFARFVAGVRILAFFQIYLSDWRRSLAGFGFMAGLAALAFALFHAVLLYWGILGWSAEAWSEFGWKVAERTLVALLVTVMLVIVEEIIFRSFLTRYLRWNETLGVTVAAIVVSSAIFAVSHLVAYPAEAATANKLHLLFGLFLLGALLATVYVVTRSLACAIGLHFGLLGVKVFLRKTDLVFTRTETWLTGTFDLRMSPIVWLLLLLLIVVAVLARHWLAARFAVEPSVVTPDRQTEDRAATAAA